MNVPAFDPVLDRVSAVPVSFTETEALAELWSHGEDGWLREDLRFRPTPWGRWIPADRYLINDLLVRTLREGHSELSLADQLAALSKVVGCPTAFCPADPRLRARLGIHYRPDKLRVIATSASLGSSDEAKETVKRFASDIIGKTPADFEPIT